jgi:hypothetical protein
VLRTAKGAEAVEPASCFHESLDVLETANEPGI